MKKMWLGHEIRQLVRVFRVIKPKNMILVLSVAMLVIVVGTYSIWHLRQFTSPDGRTTIDRTTYILKSSDKSSGPDGPIPLPNNLDDGTPNYDDLGVTFAGIAPIGGQVPLRRLQGEVGYYD